MNIRTPEGIVFPLVIADPVSRFLALIIDLFCITVLSGIAGGVFGFFGLIHQDLAMGFTMISWFVISIGYPMVMEWGWRGQTIGKRILKLRVMDVEGLRLQISQVVIRNLLRLFDALPMFYFAGGIVSLLSARGQRIGDLAGNTIVVRIPVVREPDLDQVLPGKFNSFRAYQHLAARLRQNVSPREAGIALEAIIRRDVMDAEARLVLFGRLREHMGRAAVFPPEAVEGISDEQYVRNVVDILFRVKEV